MAAVRKREGEKTPRMTYTERKFFAAVKNPKPASELLTEMFRRYGAEATGDDSSEGEPRRK